MKSAQTLWLQSHINLTREGQYLDLRQPAVTPSNNATPTMQLCRRARVMLERSATKMLCVGKVTYAMP